MRRGTRRSWAFALALGLLITFHLGCAGSGAYSDGWHGEMDMESAPTRAERISQDSSRRRGGQPGGAEHSSPPAGSAVAMESDRGERAEGEAEKGAQESRGQLLIYTGSVVLAIYDVASTQEKVVELVEEMGGYVAHRSNERLVLRVPAGEFREALEQISALGDVLNLNWQAQDVSDEVRDLDIRLRNALELRNRLEELLDRAESVEDALKIETELERITLEIERIRGQLLSFEDRIAYSTIEVAFRPRRTHEVPDDEFLLPFRWLNRLGLQSLLREPEVRR